MHRMSSSGYFSIRRLTPDDLALMEAMMAMFGEAFDEIATYTAARPGREYLERLLDAKNFRKGSPTEMKEPPWALY